ncbi:MAG: glycoside hydrolase family 3 C-terminal domain-containing protein, partial [Clostridia bacterium]|nr:glycoside hydrolase family 3 C-terminal domain-containing protein [Clostridia bacterium]
LKKGEEDSGQRAEAKRAVSQFRLGDKISICAPKGVRTVFPDSPALAATFDTAQIARVAEALAKEISNSVCVEGSCFPVTGFTPDREGYGSEELLSYECCRAFVKGFEKPSAGNLSAFPMVKCDDENMPAIRRWLSGNMSRGIQVSGEGRDFNKDLKRFSGVIYAVPVDPIELGPTGDLNTELRARAKRYAESGVTAGTAYSGEGSNGLNEKQATAFAERIAKLPSARKDKNIEVIRSAKHISLATRAAMDSVVLVKNNGVLPLDGPIENVAVIGSAALKSGEEGVYSERTPLDCLKKCFSKINFRCCPYFYGDSGESEQALSIAKRCDAAFLYIGKDDISDGENYEKVACFTQKLAKAVETTVVVCLCAPKDLSAFAPASAIIVGWQTGEFAGAAVAETIGGMPTGGRLPYPVKAGEADGKAVYYPFGHGLSMGRAEVSVAAKSGGTVRFHAENDTLETVKKSVLLYEKTGENYRFVAFTKVRIEPMQLNVFTMKLPQDLPANAELYISTLVYGNGSERLIKVLD